MLLKTTLNHLAGAALSIVAASSFAAGSLSVEREVTVDGAPATVWKLIGDFNAFDVWHPAVVESTQTGSGNRVGATRMLSLKGGGAIDEKLVAYDAAAHRYTYAITKSPLPVKNYVSTIAVSPAAGGKSQVRWNSTFDANGAEDAKAKDVISGIYDAGLGRAVAIFKK